MLSLNDAEPLTCTDAGAQTNGIFLSASCWKLHYVIRKKHVGDFKAGDLPPNYVWSIKMDLQ